MAAIVLASACSGVPENVDYRDANRQEIQRVEPLSWWVGMKTDLQLRARTLLPTVSPWPEKALA